MAQPAGRRREGGTAVTDSRTTPAAGDGGPDEVDTLDLSTLDIHSGSYPDPVTAGRSELLDDPVDWGPVTTGPGVLHLVPVRPGRDLGLLTAWMNDPVVAEFWDLAGPAERVLDHLRPQLEGDGRSVPCLGVLDGEPMSYWEIYRADLDPLARYCPVRPHDTGVHLLIGPPRYRGRGTGTALLRGVAELILRRRPKCSRVVAEPDVRNGPSVAAFRRAGFRLDREIRLPDKLAALMMLERPVTGGGGTP
ncbi:GNAT family N-acetyltransferase [Streptomyces alkaliphilus]|uniref:GNAT family N-acetyltransferase n=1 Tax=Streptomyces alkaliphilus TaxID=1472722 RepID=UPI00117DFC74|nr:GNAT family N-acetyltransferase [Streptomyces alkaliphilus]